MAHTINVLEYFIKQSHLNILKYDKSFTHENNNYGVLCVVNIDMILCYRM